MDATAATRPELQSRVPFTAVLRTVHQPQHLYDSSPSTLDARVPATKDQAHDPTARLTIHSSQPGEWYSTFLNLPLDECIVNTPQSNQMRETKTEKNKETRENLNK